MRTADKITMTVVWLFAALVVAVLAAGLIRVLGLPFGTSNIIAVPFNLYVGYRLWRVWNA